MAGRRLLLVVAVAVALALVGVEPTGLRSEPEYLAADVAPTAQNGATGVHADPGAHGATVVGAVRSLRRVLDRLVPVAVLVGVVAALILVASRPTGRLRPVAVLHPASPWRAGTPALRGPPVAA